MTDKRSAQADNLLELEDDLEKKVEAEGYRMGFDKGGYVGKEEGYAQGLIEGAKRGAEVGEYGGFAMTWIQLMKLSDEDHKQASKQSTKILNKLNEIVELVENFPKQNETLCEDKLNSLRVKFKQTKTMLNIKL